MDRKYGIQCIPLAERYPAFIDDCQSYKVAWEMASNDIRSRIQSFLINIAKIRYKDFSCHCCLYPDCFASSYVVFVDIDDGVQCLLLDTIRDGCQYPNSGRRIQMLKDSLLLLDASPEQLKDLRKGFV